MQARQGTRFLGKGKAESPDRRRGRGRRSDGPWPVAKLRPVPPSLARAAAPPFAPALPRQHKQQKTPKWDLAEDPASSPRPLGFLEDIHSPFPDPPNLSHRPLCLPSCLHSTCHLRACPPPSYIYNVCTAHVRSLLESPPLSTPYSPVCLAGLSSHCSRRHACLRPPRADCKNSPLPPPHGLFDVVLVPTELGKCLASSISFATQRESPWALIADADQTRLAARRSFCHPPRQIPFHLGDFSMTTRVVMSDSHGCVSARRPSWQRAREKLTPSGPSTWDEIPIARDGRARACSKRRRKIVQ